MLKVIIYIFFKYIFFFVVFVLFVVHFFLPATSYELHAEIIIFRG